jgi:hypothetical protein
VYGRLDSLEQQVFQRNMASGRMITERLDLMEQKLLGQRHSGESVDTRLKRIEDTLRPIQNRYAQGYYPPQPVNPAPQTFTYPTPAPAATPPSSARPNVQIGSGFSSNSSMTFSQDMLDMLPPDIRQQLQGSASTMGAPVQRYQSSSQSGLGGWNTRGAQTAIGNGSVIIREETMNNGIGGFPGFGFNSSGFSSFGGSGFGTPMYGLPSTTFSQPLDRFGNPLPYSGYTTVNPGFGRPGYVVPNGLGVPNRQNRQFMAPGGAGYQIMGPDGVVDTNMLQRLNQMERRVYGQPQPNMPYYNRLNQLEMSMLGQSFHGYSDVDRMNNLIQADTAQRLGRRMGRGFLGQLGRTAGSMMLGVPLSPVYPGAPVTTW